MMDSNLIVYRLIAVSDFVQGSRPPCNRLATELDSNDIFTDIKGEV